MSLTSDTDNSFSINRNILECKGVFLMDLLMVLLRINRNILECKGKKQALTLRRLQY